MIDNVAVVRQFFAALERGDLPGAIQFVGEEVDWQSPVTRMYPPEIPWSRIRHTKQEVTEFFKELGQKVRPEGFKLLQITAQDDRVVVEGQNRGTVHKTGQTYEHDWVMIFSVRDNKIVRFRHYYDTGDLVGSFRGEYRLMWLLNFQFGARNSKNGLANKSLPYEKHYHCNHLVSTKHLFLDSKFSMFLIFGIA